MAQSELKQSIDNTTDATIRLAKGGQLVGDSLSDGAKKAKGEFDNLKKSMEQSKTLTVTNPFGTMTGVENFLKQAGLDEQQAMQISHRATNGGRDMTNLRENLRRIAAGMGIQLGDYDGDSVALLKIAESLRYGKAHQSSQSNITADDVMNSFDKRLEDTKRQAKAEAKQDLMKQLIEENKRRANW